MAAKIFETHESRSRDGKTLTLNYFVYNTTDDTEVWATLATRYPNSYEGYINPEPSIRPVASNAYNCTVSYSKQDGKEADGESPTTEPGEDDALTSDDGVSFDISPSSFKLFQSFQTLDSVAVTGTAPSFNRAINVNRGKVEGVELGAASFTFTLTRTRARTTLRYIRLLKEMQFTINDYPFYGLEAGEVLFMGASGSATGGKPYVIQYKFGVELNQSYVEVSDGLSFGYKRGWDYIWALYADNVDANTLIQVPTSAYIEEVYETTDFSLLGV